MPELVAFLLKLFPYYYRKLCRRFRYRHGYPINNSGQKLSKYGCYYFLEERPHISIEYIGFALELTQDCPPGEPLIGTMHRRGTPFLPRTYTIPPMVHGIKRSS